MFARTIAKEETSGASHSECKNTNWNCHDGTGGSCLNPLTPVTGWLCCQQNEEYQTRIGLLSDRNVFVQWTTDKLMMVSKRYS
jgi:hypothetical protein